MDEITPDDLPQDDYDGLQDQDQFDGTTPVRFMKRRWEGIYGPGHGQRINVWYFMLAFDDGDYAEGVVVGEPAQFSDFAMQGRIMADTVNVADDDSVNRLIDQADQLCDLGFYWLDLNVENGRLMNPNYDEAETQEWNPRMTDQEAWKLIEWWNNPDDTDSDDLPHHPQYM